MLSKPMRLLHFAPEPVITAELASQPHLVYVSTDIAHPADVRTDMMALGFADESFDAIVCMHVLEHVPDDRVAMRELLRILRPGGWAILQVPVNKKSAVTDEDPRVTSPEERRRRFLQEDHCRLYGLDYEDRLKSAGFGVSREEPAAWLSIAEVKRFGVPDEDVYFCLKQ